jgi:hypothetical protein
MSTATKRSPRAHFRFKGKYAKRLSFCIGGTVIAAWPAKDNPFTGRLCNTGTHAKQMSNMNFLERVFLKGDLPTTQADTRRLVTLLRATLLWEENGPRYRSAYRQRERLDLFLAGLPQPPRRKKRKVELSIAAPADRHRMAVEKKRSKKQGSRPDVPPSGIAKGKDDVRQSGYSGDNGPNRGGVPRG